MCIGQPGMEWDRRHLDGESDEQQDEAPPLQFGVDQFVLPHGCQDEQIERVHFPARWGQFKFVIAGDHVVVVACSDKNFVGNCLVIVHRCSDIAHCGARRISDGE